RHAMNPSFATEIESFVAKYSPSIADELRRARAKLRALFPKGYELVYDNYNALVFGFGPTERASDAVVSLAGYPKWLTLFFLQGALLEDREHLLQGSGSRVRNIRLASPLDLDRPEILALIDLAAEPYSAMFAAAQPLKTVVKSVSDKQHPRQPSGIRPNNTP